MTSLRKDKMYAGWTIRRSCFKSGLSGRKRRHVVGRDLGLADCDLGWDVQGRYGSL